MKKEYIIPIFVPHLGCPNNCTFCNQKRISGQTKMVTAKDVEETIEYYLKNFRDNHKYVEVAVFGGSFTAIEKEKQEELLKATQKYIKDGTNPIVKHYGEQYNTIEACVNKYKSKETRPKNLEFVNRLFKVMKNLREDRVLTYAKMYDNFARAGCNISNFCNNVRLKGGVSLGLKTLFTFFSPS